MSWDRFIYSESDLIGKGTYASVYAARDSSGVKVALKKITFEHIVEGCPLLLLREVGLMKKLAHPNIVSILDVEYLPAKGTALIAFELLSCDLRQYLNNHGPFRGESLIRASAQAAEGVAFLHSHGIIHRDLKPHNILVDCRQGGNQVIKIADLGLARPYFPQLTRYTKEVMTLWYRCPELLLGATTYGPLADCWSLGCLIAEMGSGTALFTGESEVAVMFKIFRTIGTPSGELNWPGVESLPYFSRLFPKWIVTDTKIREHFFDILVRPTFKPRSATTPRERVRSGQSFAPLSPNHDHIYCLVSQILCEIFKFSPSLRISAAEVAERLLLTPDPSYPLLRE